MLGEDGQARYAALVAAEFAKLGPPASPGRYDEHWSRDLGVLHRMEAVASLQRDFDTLQRVLTRDLSSGAAFIRMVEACRDFGREREALQWAERGVKAHPQWGALRSLLAEELQRAGLGQEAVDTLWQGFKSAPDRHTWQSLKLAAQAQWTAYRERALDHLRAAERHLDDGRPEASLRIELLMLDGDLEAARLLARQAAVRPGRLRDLASRIAADHPADAAALLRRVVNSDLPRVTPRDYAPIALEIAQVLRLAPGVDSQRWVDEIKLNYRARRKLMGLMADQGL